MGHRLWSYGRNATVRGRVSKIPGYKVTSRKAGCTTSSYRRTKQTMGGSWDGHDWRVAGVGRIQCDQHVCGSFHKAVTHYTNTHHPDVRRHGLHLPQSYFSHTWDATADDTWPRSAISLVFYKEVVPVAEHRRKLYDSILPADKWADGTVEPRDRTFLMVIRQLPSEQLAWMATLCRIHLQ